MQRKEAISFIFKVILLGLAILLIIFGLYPKLLNGENQEIHFESPDGKSMPEEGYETELISGLSYTTVEVSARGEDVEVHMYVSSFRGGTVIQDGNESVIRDEWLAAGDKGERIGRDIKLSDFSAYPAKYRVRVVEPEGSIPSDADYIITIRSYSVDITLIIAGLLCYAIFIFLGIFEYLSSINRTLKSGVAMAPAGAAEASDLEALLEPAAAGAPAMAMAPEPAPPAAPAPTSYEAMMAQSPAPAPAYAPPAPPPSFPEAPPAYAPPPPAMPPPPAAPPPAPAYQPAPPAAPPPVAQAPPPAPPAPVPAAPVAAPEPVSKVRCPSCKSIVPVYTNERPTPIECPTCGKKGMIR